MQESIFATERTARNVSDKREKMKWSSVFVWYVFACNFVTARFGRIKCPINFGITRYARLITIIMWCHCLCGSANDSNGHVYAITFWLHFFLPFFLLLSVSSLPKAIRAICLGTNWVGFVVAIGVDWCWYLLLIVYYIWHFYDFAQTATACNGQGICWTRISKERKTKPTCHCNTKKETVCTSCDWQKIKAKHLI